MPQRENPPRRRNAERALTEPKSFWHRVSPGKILDKARLGLPLVIGINPFAPPAPPPPAQVQPAVDSFANIASAQINPTAGNDAPLTLGMLESMTGWSGPQLQKGAADFYPDTDLQSIDYTNKDTRISYEDYSVLNSLTSRLAVTWRPHAVAPEQQIAYFAIAYDLTPDQTSRLADASRRLAAQFPNLSPNDTTVELLDYVGALMRGSPLLEQQPAQDFKFVYDLPPIYQPKSFEDVMLVAAVQVAQSLQPRARVANPPATTNVAIQITVGPNDFKLSDKALTEILSVIPAVAPIPGKKKSQPRKRTTNKTH